MTLFERGGGEKQKRNGVYVIVASVLLFERD